MDTLIRMAFVEDGPSVVRLVHELASFDHEECTLDLAFVQSYLRLPGANILIAEEDQEAVGLVSYWIRPNLYHAGMVCLIEEFIVASGYRSRGIGSKLLTEVIRRAREIDCAEVSVSTHDHQRVSCSVLPPAWADGGITASGAAFLVQLRFSRVDR